MDEQVAVVAERGRKPKEALDNRSFMDGAIYLFRRADYKKPTWFCRVRVPKRTGYISCSTKTTDEHKAFSFADSCDAAQAYRFDAARDSWMMPPTVTR